MACFLLCDIEKAGGLCYIESMEMGENKRQRVLKCLVAVASAMYCLSLVWVLWLKFADAEQLLINFKNINLIPEEELWFPDKYLFKDPEFLTRQILEIVLNCLVLFPLGVGLNILTDGKKVWLHILICTLFAVTIELVQRFTLIGGFSVMDIVTNVAGYFVGWGLYKLIFKRLKAKTLTVIALVCIVCLLAVLIYAVVSIVSIKDTLNHLFSQL